MLKLAVVVILDNGLCGGGVGLEDIALLELVDGDVESSTQEPCEADLEGELVKHTMQHLSESRRTMRQLITKSVAMTAANR